MINSNNKQDNNIKGNIKNKGRVLQKLLISKYYNKLLNNHSIENKLFICFILSSILSVATMFSFMKVSFSFRDERIIEIQNQLESYKSKIHSISTSLDSLTNDLDKIKSDVKNNKESASNGLVRLANLLKDIQNIKATLNISSDTPSAPKEENLDNLPSDKREFIESFENLVKDGVPFSNFIEKINTAQYPSIKELIKYKDINIKSIEALKKDFSAIASSVFGNQVKESFWQKQFRIFKEKISDAIRIESSNGKIHNLGNNLDDKVLFENAQSCINNYNNNDKKLEECYEFISKIKSTNEKLLTLKAEVSNRLGVNKAFKQFKHEFIEKESEN